MSRELGLHDVDGLLWNRAISPHGVNLLLQLSRELSLHGVDLLLQLSRELGLHDVDGLLWSRELSLHGVDLLLQLSRGLHIFDGADMRCWVLPHTLFCDAERPFAPAALLS